MSQADEMGVSTKDEDKDEEEEFDDNVETDSDKDSPQLSNSWCAMCVMSLFS